MSRRVLDVGNCVPDHTAITELIEGSFDAHVVRVHNGDEAIEALKTGTYDLVLINRLMDRDQSSGLDIIKRITSTPEMSSIPVMMITNFPDHQKLAEDAGAQPGFGKQELGSPKLVEKFKPFLQ